MNDRDDEDLLAIYRRSRDEQPSEILDQRIRQAAQKTSRRRQGNWLWGLSKVAVVVLSFSVVLQIWLDSQTIDEVVTLEEENTQGLPMVVLPQRSMELPSQQALREVQPSEATNRQKRSMQESATTPGAVADVEASAPAIDRFAASAEPAASMLADEELATDDPGALSDNQSTIPFDVPELPTGLRELSQLVPQLTVERDDSGLLTVYDGSRLILSMTEEADGYTFKAWSGSEVLGINFPWDMQADNLSGCRQLTDYLSCTISNEISGYFEDQRLDHIEWKQNRSSR